MSANEVHMKSSSISPPGRQGALGSEVESERLAAKGRLYGFRWTQTGPHIHNPGIRVDGHTRIGTSLLR
jgi:hypothetical protein